MVYVGNDRDVSDVWGGGGTHEIEQPTQLRAQMHHDIDFVR